MSDEEYNGWSNYATWRINLECCDQATCRDFGVDPTVEDFDWDEGVDTVADGLREMVEMNLESEARPQSLVFAYAMAFISEVNWREIASHIVENND